MKKFLFPFFVMMISSSLIFQSCSKKDTDNTAPGPAIVGSTEGFLSTKSGYSYGSGIGDTVYVRAYTSSYTIAGTLASGIYESIEHYWYIESAGPNKWYFRSRKHGYYLGFRNGGQSPGYYDWAIYWVTLDKTPTEKNVFIANKVGKNFYLQLAIYPDLYVNTTTSSQISYTGPKRPESLFLLPKKQEFFFMKPF